MECMCGMVRLEGVVGMGSKKRAEEKHICDLQVTCMTRNVICNAL